MIYAYLHGCELKLKFMFWCNCKEIIFSSRYSVDSLVWSVNAIFTGQIITVSQFWGTISMGKANVFKTYLKWESDFYYIGLGLDRSCAFIVQCIVKMCVLFEHTQWQVYYCLHFFFFAVLSIKDQLFRNSFYFPLITVFLLLKFVAKQ